MTKCYILGAGASYGYNENLSKQGRPPLTKEFFTKGSSLGIFSEEKYPDLGASLIEYQEEKKIDVSSMDIEEFLAWLHKKFTQNTRALREKLVVRRGGQPSEKSAINYQIALGEAFLFVWDLLRYYTTQYNPEFDSYRRIALHFFDEKYNVITLNYDCIFEVAVQSIGCGFHYYPAPKHPRSIGIAKLHGSVNWINPCTREWGGAIAFGGLAGEKAIKAVTSVIYSNKMWTSKIPIDLPIQHLKYLKIPDLIRSGTDWDEPAIIPPLDNYKDYEKTPRYDMVWQFAASMLRNTSELVVIGCSIRESDRKFLELLSDSVGEKVSVTVADPHSEVVVGQLKKHLKSSPFIEKTYGDFEEYTRTL